MLNDCIKVFFRNLQDTTYIVPEFIESTKINFNQRIF